MFPMAQLAQYGRSRLRVLLWLVGLVAASCVLGPTAHAQEQHEPPAEAMQFFERAREAYREGRYPDAAEDLERALVLDPNAPALLFNLGRVYELMGRYDDSIQVYMRLRAVTPPEASAEIARTNEILERLQGAREHAAPPPTVETVGSIEQGPTFVRERGVADEAFWGTLIAGGVVVIGAAIVGALALSMHDGLAQRVLGSTDDAGNVYTYDDYSAELANAQTLGLIADIGYGVGGATMVAAVILFAVRERVYEQWPDGRQVHLDVGPGSVSLRGVF